MAPSGLYARLCHAFLVFTFLMVDFLDSVDQNVVDRCSPKFQNWQKLGQKDQLTSFSFLRSLNGRCHGTQLKQKNRHFFWTNLLCHTAVQKRIAISQFRIQAVKQNEFLYIVYIHTVNNNTIVAITPNISEYPGPILSYFKDMVGVLVAMIIPIFVWRLPKERCYGNQLNLEDIRRHRQERPSLVASTFDNRFASRKSAF